MKKLLTVLLSATLLVFVCFAASACSTQSKKLKVYTEYDLTAESYAFAVRKGNSDVLNAANELLTELKANGELENIINSFFNGTADFKYTNPVGTTPTDHNAYLIVATNAYFPPFEYYEGNKLTGVDMKIASLLAAKLNKTLYILDEEFDTIIPSVQNGEADIGMAGMTVTETRLEQVDFTEEYYESAQVLIVAEDDVVFADCKNADDIIDVLKNQNNKFIVGTQQATTGYMFSAGDEDFGYDGFKNLTTKHYSNGALATKDLSNGKINAVIIDKQPAIMITNSING